MIALKNNDPAHIKLLYRSSQGEGTYKCSGTSIFPPKGKHVILAFCYHQHSKRFPFEFMNDAIKKDLGVVYVCDKLPSTYILNDHIVYVITQNRWFSQHLFREYSHFKGIYYNEDPDAQKVVESVLQLTKFDLDVMHDVQDLSNLANTLTSLEQKAHGSKRIVLETFDGLGDVLMSLPTAKTLHDRGCQVSYVVNDIMKPALKHLTFIDKVYANKEAVPSRDFDEYISTSGKLSDYRLEFNQKHRIYSTARFFDIAPDDLVIQKPIIKLTKEEKHYAKKMLKKHTRPIGICWKAYNQRRNYPEKQTQELCTILSQRGYTPIIIGKDKVKTFVDAVNLSGKTSIRQFFSLIEACEALITVDSSPLHVAGAFDLPTVALCGPIPAEWRCSTYPKCYPIVPTVPCYPCADCQYAPQNRRHCHNRACLSYIKAESIADKLDLILKKRKVTLPNEPIVIPPIPTPPSTTNGKSVLITMRDGELGDKIVALGVISEWKRQHPEYTTIDVLIGSERYHGNDGYAQLFRDCATNTYTRVHDIPPRRRYDTKYSFSPTDSHDEEVQSALHKEVQFSRYQRWAKKLEYTFRGRANATYRVKEKDGEGLKEKGYYKILQNHECPIVVICPITSNKTKDWEDVDIKKGSPKWQKVISHLAKTCTVITLHHTPLAYKNCTNLGKLSVPEVGYVISKASLVIGCEAGLTHFAGMLGTPMMVLVGSSSALVLRHYKNVRVVHKGPCESCNRFIIPTLVGIRCGNLVKDPHSKCLTTISAREIIQEAKKFLETILKRGIK